VLVFPFCSRAGCCCSSVVVCAPTDKAIASPTAASDKCFMPFPPSSLIYRSSRERRISHFAYAKALSVYAVLMRRKIPTIYFAACESIIGKVPRWSRGREIGSRKGRNNGDLAPPPFARSTSDERENKKTD